MERIILALTREAHNRRVKEVLEGAGAASCLICTSADQVRRAAAKYHIDVVVCGYKLGDQPVELLAGDLPPTCSLLVLAPQDRLELLNGEGLFPLSTPVSRRDLVAAVQMLLGMTHSPEGHAVPQRSSQEQALILQAKQLLMDRHGMTEPQAHRFLQKASMDRGARLAQTAQLVLESALI